MTDGELGACAKLCAWRDLVFWYLFSWRDHYSRILVRILKIHIECLKFSGLSLVRPEKFSLGCLPHLTLKKWTNSVSLIEGSSYEIIFIGLGFDHFFLRGDEIESSFMWRTILHRSFLVARARIYNLHVRVCACLVPLLCIHSRCVSLLFRFAREGLRTSFQSLTQVSQLRTECFWCTGM